MSVIDPLKAVARQLGTLRERVVFVGGMIRSLLVTDPAAGPARPTVDVDLIVDVPTQVALMQLGEQLRAVGFRESHEEGDPICRWVASGVRVDVMPLDPAILGFSNVWYPSGFETATTVTGFDGRVLDAAHFCATKIEAFASRAGGDLFHHDLEDVVAVVDGRETLVDEIASSSDDLRSYLAEAIGDLLALPAFMEALPGHLMSDAASQARLPLVIDRLRRIAALAPKAQKKKHEASTVGEVSGTLLQQPTILRSSNLQSADYDAASQTLTVGFRGGGVYEYYGVPETIFSGLLHAASAGRYLHRWIRTRYRYRRIR